MKNRMFGIVCCALPLAACGQPAEERVTTHAREAVTRRLIDPGSARFRDVYIVEGGDRHPVDPTVDNANRHVVCGWVDGKNRAGIRVGFRRFSWSDPNGALWVDGNTRGSRDPWCVS